MTTGITDPGATAQQRLARVVRTVLHPRLKTDGFTRSGHTWRRGDPEHGWVFVQLQGNRYNTAARVEVTVNTVVWPAGTWDVHCAVTGQDPSDRPFVAANAPVFARPREIAPDLAEDSWWHLDVGTDLAQWGAQLVEFVADTAVPWGTRLLDPAAAVQRLTALGSVWDLVFTFAVLRHFGRSDQCTAVVEDLTRVWAADPRPIWLRPHLLGWRRAAGLSETPLPEVWSPSMLPDTVARFGSPEAARAAGFGVWMYSWDGRSWQDRPET